MLIKPGALQFSEYLKQLPPALVIEHFFTEKSTARRILSSAMINECARKCSDPDELRRRFLSLDKKQRLRCAQMYLMGSMGSVSDTFHGFDDPIVGAFLGYAAGKQEGEVRVFGFGTFEPAIRNLLAAAIAEAAMCGYNEVPAAVCPWRCCNDITIAVSLASQHLLIRKRSGNLAKSALLLIKKFIQAGEMHKIEDIDIVAGMIIEYCVSRHFLTEEELEYRYCPAAFTEWLKLPVGQRIDDITAFCIMRCGGWNRELLLQVCDTAAGQWLSDASFMEKDRQRLREMLLLYQFIGIIEIRKHGAEFRFQRINATVSGTVAGRNPVVVMPDFTVVAQQECLPEHLFSFARFCRIQSLDRVYHAVIEKGVLTDALSADIDGHLIIESLKRWNAPSNVLESAREWIREFGRVSLLTENVLVCADETVARQIAAYEQLQPLIEQITAHAVFRIKPGSEKCVSNIIRRLGFDERMPRMPHVTDATQDSNRKFPDKTQQEQWSLIVDKKFSEKKAASTIRGSKYGAELKMLELSEMLQVIEYAILTSQRIVISYEGSPYLRKGSYTLAPIVCSNGPEPMLDAELLRSGTRKQFYVKKISAIGVVP